MPTPSEMYDEGWHQGYTHALAVMAGRFADRVESAMKVGSEAESDRRRHLAGYVVGIEWAQKQLLKEVQRADAEKWGPSDRSRS